MERSTVSVLLVEGADPAAARRLTDLLATEARRVSLVSVVASVRAACETLAGPANIDAVLLDGTIPEVDASAAIAAMKAARPQVSVILIDHASGRDGATLHARGADDRLPAASLEAELLVRTIEHAIERRHWLAASHGTLARAEAFLASCPAATFIKDASGRYVFANQRFERSLGLSPGGWRGRRDEDLLPEAAAAMLRAHDAAVLDEGRSLEFQEVIPGLDGECEWLSYRFPLSTSPGVMHVAGMAVDVTRRTRADEALRVAETARLAAVQMQADALDALPDRVALLDEHGKVVAANRAWRRRSAEHSPFEADIVVAQEDIDPADAQRVLRALHDVLAGLREGFSIACRRGTTPGSRRLEMVAHRSGGAGRPLVAVMIREVEAIAPVEESAATRLYRRVIETSHEGIWVTDREGRTTLANRRLAAMLGRDDSEMAGLRLADVARASEVLLAEAAERSSGGWPVQYELELAARDGRVVTASVSACSMLDESGMVEGTLRMLDDVTERRATDRAVRETQQQLGRMQKLEAIGLLAEGVAHDINNLLTAVRGYAGLTRSALGPDHPALESLDQVEEAARQASGVASSLLTFAKGGASEKSPVRLASIVEEAARLFRRTLGARIDLSIDTREGEDLWVLGDRTHLHQVITHLALNARDAVREQGGAISIRVEPDRGGKQTQTWAAILVEDDGSGMPPEVQGKIFDPFFTTKPAGEGMGLGLSMIHGIVKDHGGRIEVHSAPGEGSRFRVLLPCVAAGAAGATTTVLASTAPSDWTAEGPATRLPPGPAMVVQESPMIRGVVGSMLASLGYEVVYASDMAGSLETARGHGAATWLLVSDAVLRDGSARTLLESLRRTVPEACGVAIADTTPEEGTELPGMATLRKPFRIADLEACLRTLGSAAATSSG
ncbi:MAG: PAS domain-containing protein [Phycisphaerae bacterium]